MAMNQSVSGGTFTVSTWFSLILVNFRSSSHQQMSGKPAFFASSSRRQRFHVADDMSARGEYRSSLKSALTCISTVVRLVFGPQSDRHPNLPYAGNSKGSLQTPSPQTSSIQTGYAVPTSQFKMSTGEPILVSGRPSVSIGTTASRTEDSTLNALSASDWM